MSSSFNHYDSATKILLNSGGHLIILCLASLNIRLGMVPLLSEDWCLQVSFVNCSGGLERRWSSCYLLNGIKEKIEFWEENNL